MKDPILRRSPSNAQNARDALHAATCSSGTSRSFTQQLLHPQDREVEDEKVQLALEQEECERTRLQMLAAQLCDLGPIP